jgi:hypothetical protein
MTEDELVLAVMDALMRSGWTVTHHRRSDRAITQGDPGEPDVRGVKDGRALWIECKSYRGRLTDAQVLWLAQLREVPDAVVRVIRPDDLTPFVQELHRTAGMLSYGRSESLDAELVRHELVHPVR